MTDSRIRQSDEEPIPAPSTFVAECRQALEEYLRDRADGITHEAAILPLKKILTRKESE